MVSNLQPDAFAIFEDDLQYQTSFTSIVPETPALKSTSLNPSNVPNSMPNTPFYMAVFSSENIDCIQDGIIKGVNEKGYRISRQSDSQLKIIIMNMLESFYPRLNNSIMDDLKRFNVMVTNYSISTVVDNIIAQRKSNAKFEVLMPADLPLPTPAVKSNKTGLPGYINRYW